MFFKFFLSNLSSICVCFSCTVIIVAHFLQTVSSGLVLGGELVYHRGRAEEGGILTLAGQYSSEIYVNLLWTLVLPDLFLFGLAAVFFFFCLSPCRTELGSDTECWERRCPCQLLSQSQQAGTANTTMLCKNYFTMSILRETCTENLCLCSPDPSWRGVWSQYQDTGDHNLIWVPDGTPRSQHGLSR